MVTTVVDTDKEQMSERWVLKETGVKTGRLDTVKARKLAYYEETRELPLLSFDLPSVITEKRPKKFKDGL